jgi:hypothetical protein
MKSLAIITNPTRESADASPTVADLGAASAHGVIGPALKITGSASMAGEPLA